MSIEDRNLKPGTVLVAVFPARGPQRKEHRCEVVKGKDGTVVYRLKGGQEFTSLSGAGSACMNGVACNGWRFWSLEGDLPAPKAATTPKAARTAKSAAKPVSKPKAKAKAAAKAAKRAKQPKAEKNGALPAKPIACGHCGQEFPDGHAAADHMRDTHGAPEAAGSGGR